jgi:hypothetical protein
MFSLEYFGTHYFGVLYSMSVLSLAILMGFSDAIRSNKKAISFFGWWGVFSATFFAFTAILYVAEALKCITSK